MFVSHDREKLLNAIVYFLRETNHCHTLKLFKLLNFTDFEHFRQKGRTIFGVDYYALPMGPVPQPLYNEIKNGGDKDLRSVVALFEVKKEFSDELLRRDIKPRVAFDKKVFTKRELKVMARIAEMFRDLRAADMTEFSHQNKKPWATIYRDGKGRDELIPPDLILDSEPLMHEVPTISSEALEYRRELLRDTA